MSDSHLTGHSRDLDVSQQPVPAASTIRRDSIAFFVWSDVHEAAAMQRATAAGFARSIAPKFWYYHGTQIFIKNFTIEAAEMDYEISDLEEEIFRLINGLTPEPPQNVRSPAPEPPQDAAQSESVKEKKSQGKPKPGTSQQRLMNPPRDGFKQVKKSVFGTHTSPSWSIMIDQAIKNGHYFYAAVQQILTEHNVLPVRPKAHGPVYLGFCQEKNHFRDFSDHKTINRPDNAWGQSEIEGHFKCSMKSVVVAKLPGSLMTIKHKDQRMPYVVLCDLSLARTSCAKTEGCWVYLDVFSRLKPEYYYIDFVRQMYLFCNPTYKNIHNFLEKSNAHEQLLDRHIPAEFENYLQMAKDRCLKIAKSEADKRYKEKKKNKSKNK